MKILMVLTSHDKLTTPVVKRVSGSKSSPPPTTRSRKPAQRSGLPRQRAANRLSIRRATSQTFRPSLRTGSKPMQTHKRGSLQRSASTASGPRTLTPSSTPAGTARCGIWQDRNSVSLLETMVRAGKPIALVCHAPGALRHVKAPDGKPLVQGKRVTGFTNTEEEAVGLTKVVPFLVEDELKAKGGIFSKAADWQPYVLTDGLLITGQNPASSGPGANALVDLMNRMAK